MKKSLIYILLFILIIISINIFFINKNNNNISDSKKFKEEYEILNNTKSNSGNTYNNLSISNNNPIIYSNYNQILNVINNDTGIIYLGFPECPWCRTMLPILFDVANDYNIDKIYYLNILNERDSYVVDNEKLVYKKNEKGEDIKGTKGYFKLLKVLDSYLDNYIIYDNSREYDTNEKRIYAPTVIFVKNGSILGIHVSTVETQKSGYDVLSKEEYNELYSIYENYIKKINSTTCSLNSSC